MMMPMRLDEVETIAAPAARCLPVNEVIDHIGPLAAVPYQYAAVQARSAHFIG